MPYVPSAYRDGYIRAADYDRNAADAYIAHTVIGDPPLDAVLEELADVPMPELQAYLKACMDQTAEARSAPRVLRDFFDSLAPTPDEESFMPGIRAFHANLTPVLVSFVTAVLIEGFSTLISKSVVISGRGVYDQSVRRFRQNNRHLVEIFMPGGLGRHGDGWKLTVRIRLVHAQMRRLLRASSEWDEAAWGTPLSAAHMGYATACFASQLLRRSTQLGASFSPEERASFVSVWRYTARLMGVPDAILFPDEHGAVEMYRVAHLCEPPPDEDSIITANAMINSAPLIGDIEDRAMQKQTRELAYRLSRALIGNSRADLLRFPESRTLGLLFFYRLHYRLQRAMLKLRGQDRAARGDGFINLLGAAVYDDTGISYTLPDHIHSEDSSLW